MNKEITQKTKDINTKTDIRVVLNGGKEEMNSATIPIEWWFSKEVIDREPKYILIFEQSKEEKERDFDKNDSYGRRYICKVSDAIKFLQIFSPGYHRIMVVVLGGSSAESDAKHYLGHDDYDYYRTSINWENAKDNTLKNMKSIMGSTVEEFEVPEELFAKKPKTKPGKLMWKWANLWFKKNPRDECEYRKRKIIAFTIQPPLTIPWWLIKYSIGGILHALYVLLASLVILFVGFRPRPILKEMWHALTFQRDAELDVKRFENWQTERVTAYRLWSRKEAKDKDGKLKYEYKYMPITPLYIALGLSIIGCLIYVVSANVLSLATLLVIIVTTTVLVCLSILAYKKVKSAISAEAERKKEKWRKRFKDWLLKNFELSNKTDEIYFDRLPTPLTFRQRAIQKFRVSFWTLKAKICKPYPK